MEEIEASDGNVVCYDYSVYGTFNVPEDGDVYYFKLVHDVGFFTCNVDTEWFGIWGCLQYPDTIVTTSDNVYLVSYTHATENNELKLRLHTTYTVTKYQSFRIWTGTSFRENVDFFFGRHCVKVFIGYKKTDEELG